MLAKQGSTRSAAPKVTSPCCPPSFDVRSWKIASVRRAATHFTRRSCLSPFRAKLKGLQKSLQRGEHGGVCDGATLTIVAYHRKCSEPVHKHKSKCL